MHVIQIDLSPAYFPAVKVTKSIFATVRYSVNELRNEVKAVSVELPLVAVENLTTTTSRHIATQAKEAAHANALKMGYIKNFTTKVVKEDRIK